MSVPGRQKERLPLEAVACRRIRGAGVLEGVIEVKSVVDRVERVESVSVGVGLSTGIQTSVGKVKSLGVFVTVYCQ
jgi:hypothetical protein